VYGVFPALIKLKIFAPDVVVQDGCLVLALEDFARVTSMDAVILTWTSHFDHIHNVLSVRVFLLPQIEHFEFLPHRRVVTLALDGAERAQRLLGTAVFFRVRKALVHFDLSKSFLFLESKLDVIQSFVRKAD